MSKANRAWIGDAILEHHTRQFCVKFSHKHKLCAIIVSNRNLEEYARHVMGESRDGTDMEVHIYELHKQCPESAKKFTEQICEWTVGRLKLLGHRAVSDTSWMIPEPSATI